MSFDRVAAIYDATRALPPGVVEKVANRVIQATNAAPGTRFLDLGIGTGRIALPFILRGYNVTGVDISSAMMQHLRTKAGNVPNLRLIQADVTDIPLPDSSFDVVLTVHLLHLVPEWKKTLAEARRLLVPGGLFVEGHDWSVPGGPADIMRQQWRTFVEGAGTRLRPNYGTWEHVEAELSGLGCLTSLYRVAQWQEEFRPRDALEEQRNRVFSLSWDVPDDVLEDTSAKMTAWAIERFGDLDAPTSTDFEFILSVSRFPL